MVPLQFPDLRLSVELQKTQSVVDVQAGSEVVGLGTDALVAVDPMKRFAGFEMRVARNVSESHAAVLNCTPQLDSSVKSLHRRVLKSAAMALDAENRNGIPKLDSAGID